MQPAWTRRRMIVNLAGGAVVCGAVGWLFGPVWMIVGLVLGPVLTVVAFVVICTMAYKDASELVEAGRPEEAVQAADRVLPGVRKAASRWPAQFSDSLAATLLAKSMALRMLGQLPQALDVANEAVAVLGEIVDERPGRYPSLYADVLFQQAGLLAASSRHGEALVALERAVPLYRSLAVINRSYYLRNLADALAGQADALGYLDRFAEARAIEAQALLIRTDMLPAGQP